MYKTFLLPFLSLIMVMLSWTVSAKSEVSYYTDNTLAFYQTGIGLLEPALLDSSDRLDSNNLLIMVRTEMQTETEPTRIYSKVTTRTMFAKAEDAKFGLTTAALNFLPDKDATASLSSAENIYGNLSSLADNNVELLEHGWL